MILLGIQFNLCLHNNSIQLYKELALILKQYQYHPRHNKILLYKG